MQVLSLAKSHNADVSGATIIDPHDAADIPEMVEVLVSLRKDKGMTETLAKELLTTDPNWSVHCKFPVNELFNTLATHSYFPHSKDLLGIVFMNRDISNYS